MFHFRMQRNRGRKGEGEGACRGKRKHAAGLVQEAATNLQRMEEFVRSGSCGGTEDVRKWMKEVGGEIA